MKIRRVLLLLLIFVIVSVCTRGYMTPVEVIDIDESLHATGSQVLMDGGLLYTDYVDNKPPLLYVFYALAQLLLGRGLFSVHVFTILFTVPLTALACAAFYDFDRRGVASALLFLVFSASFLAHDMHSSSAELWMILPGAWALALVSDESRCRSVSRCFGAGFLIGIGVLLKYQVFVWLPAIGIACVFYSIRMKESYRWILLMAAAAAGFVLPPGLTYAWFRSRGGADAFLYWNLTNNLGYSANPILPREALGRAAAYLLPFALVTFPLWWCAIAKRHAEESAYRRVLIAALLAFTLAAVSLGLRFYPHYFIQFYVPLCLGSAPFVAAIPAGGMGRKLLAIYSVVIWTLFAAVNCVLYYGNTGVYREIDPVFRKVAVRLQQDRCYPRGTLFVWGYTPIYYFAALPPASRFAVLSQSHLTGYVSGNLESVRGKISTEGFVNPDHWKLLMDDLERNHATFIVDTAPAGIYRWDRYPVKDFPLLQNYLLDHYIQMDDIEGVVLYRRKDCF